MHVNARKIEGVEDIPKNRKRARGRGYSTPETSLGPSKRYCSFNSAWKNKEFKIDTGDGHRKTFSGNVLSGADGDTAYCTLCKVKFSVRHGGANDVRKHFSTANHVSTVTTSKRAGSLQNFGNSRTAQAARQRREKQNHKVQNAEALFVQFVAEHNLPFHTGDHFTKLVKTMFPDSEIAKQFQCSRTKTSVLTMLNGYMRN